MRLFILLFAGLTLLASCSDSAEKTAYVELEELYDSLALKQELETKLSNLEDRRRNELDSLETGLRIRMNELQAQTEPAEPDITMFQLKEQEYRIKREQYEQELLTAKEQFKQQIWAQINRHMEDYGATHGYTYIFGAQGNGSVMYAQDQRNITRAVTDFINQSYQGESAQ